jgi:Protein of unknown function (DUF2917)
MERPMNTFQNLHSLTAHAALAVPALLARNQAGTDAAHLNAGSWHLGRGRAMRLCGRQSAILRINVGRVWATLDGPRKGPANDQGDLVLAAGDQLSLAPGQGVVIEPWGATAHDPAAHGQVAADVLFSWDPLPDGLPQARGSASRVAAHSAVDALRQASAQALPRPRLQVAVGEPLRELGIALWQVARALGHLARGVAGLGEFLVAGRGRVLPCMESNPP